MGTYHAIFTATASIAFVIAIVGIGFMIKSSIVQTNLYEKETLDESNTVTISYLLKDCLYQGGDAIKEDVLSSGPDICGMCGLCGKGIAAVITDKETPPKTWSLSNSESPENEYTNTILVDIERDSGDINIGELTVTA